MLTLLMNEINTFLKLRRMAQKKLKSPLTFWD